MSFPVFEEHLDQPPQGARLGDIDGAPGHIGGDIVTVLVAWIVFERQDKAFFAVAADIEPGTAQHHGDRLPAPAAKHLRHTREALKIARHRA